MNNKLKNLYEVNQQLSVQNEQLYLENQKLKQDLNK